MSELGPNENSDAWRGVWILNNVKDLDKERDELRSILYNLLDYESDVPLPPAIDVTESKPKPKPKDPALSAKAKDLTDPAHYLFSQKKLWIPWAEDGPKAKARDRYNKGYPMGAVIHWTAGHRNTFTREMQSCKDNGYLYFVIDGDGKVGQGFPLNKWGSHAGKSSYPGLPGTVSNELVGIEVQAAGNLKKNGAHYYPWWDQKKVNGKYRHQYLAKNRIPPNQVVFSKRRGNIREGYYHKYTDKQFWALTKTLLWLRLNNPDVFKLGFVLGHDDVSPGRKTDPGAALVNPDTGKPMTTAEYRDYLADLENKILEKGQ